MKCLMKYQWVKLPRSKMPAGKGVMGAWAGGTVGLKSILGVKKRNKALELMDELARLGYIDYELVAGLVLALTMSMATTAMALEYDVDEPDSGMFAPSSSVEQVTVVGGGVTEQSNIDRSKNASVAPPSFGSPIPRS